MHFACARSHGRNALIQLIEDSGVSIAYRDELYRTARDVSMQATQPENTREIDKYVLSLAARGKLKYIFRFFRGITQSFAFFLHSGELDTIKHLVIEGYDHIIDIHDDEGTIMSITLARGHTELAKYLESIPEFEVCSCCAVYSFEK